MERSSTKHAEALAVLGPDQLSIRRWLLVYALWLAALAVPAAIMLGENWTQLVRDPVSVTRAAGAELKLLVFAVYISLACTFLPLPTAPIVSAVALRQFAPTADVWTTMVLVAAVGAAGSVMANLHDYHLFTWMLRHRRVRRVRHTAIYRRSAGWFARRPFALLVVFNVLPIPIDVVRMLAATHRYRLRSFAAANFIGRSVRYAVIAFVTFQMGSKGWVVAAALLVAAVALATGRLVGRIARRRNGQPVGQSGTMDGGKEPAR